MVAKKAKGKKKADAPATGDLPRRKRAVPEHIRRAADRAEALADGRPLPEPEGPVPEAVEATRAARRRAARRPAAAAPPVGEPAPAGEVPAGEARERPPHRETLYRAEFVERVNAMVGAVTDFDIAQELGVSTRTITRWKRIHTDFCLAISAKREMFDDEIEHSLATRALGFHYEDTHVSTYRGDVTLTPIVKYMPGDVSAQKHFLANRRPDKWRNTDTGLPPPTELSPADRNVIDATRKIMALLTAGGDALALLAAKTINGSAQEVEA